MDAVDRAEINRKRMERKKQEEQENKTVNRKATDAAPTTTQEAEDMRKLEEEREKQVTQLVNSLSYFFINKWKKF